MGYVRREPTLLPSTNLGEEFWWSSLTINFEFKQKVLQYSLAAVTLLCDSQWF
jgi:hypothetical protein